MASPTGMPIWYELLTPDVEAAQRFYGALTGWTFTAMPAPPGAPPYTIVEKDGAGIAGLAQPIDGLRPGWLAYLHVADVDAKAAEVTAAGGAIELAPFDLPHVGRMARVTDPQGVRFYLMTPTPPPGMADVENTSFHHALPGRVAWNELITTDEKAALPFYRDLFGWTSSGAMPMGPAGDYTFIDHDGGQIGAMMNRMSPEQPLAWSFYWKVPDADRAAEQVRAGGGTVVAGPMEVPGGQRVVMTVDPQGCGVGFVSGERP